MNTVTDYYPESGTGSFAVVELLRKNPSAEFVSAELAKVMQCTIKSVSGSLARAVDSGLLVKRREGRKTFYSYGAVTPPDPARGALLQPMPHSAIARMAAIKLKDGATLSSVTLAEQCHTTPEVIDAALAPLANAHKLTRISVLRRGVEMFDYRYSAFWAPKEADFDFEAPANVPHSALSPVAPPKPRPAPAPTPSPVNPATPWRKLGSLVGMNKAIEPCDALASGAVLGQKMGVPDSNLADAAKALGWQIGKATGLDGATLEASQSTDTVPNILEADDMVMALNSRGEFVIDLGGGDLVKFPPAQALCLKRFLDNTSVLEDLASQGAV